MRWLVVDSCRLINCEYQFYISKAVLCLYEKVSQFYMIKSITGYSMDTGSKLTWHVPRICTFYVQYGTICVRSSNVTSLSHIYMPSHTHHPLTWLHFLRQPTSLLSPPLPLAPGPSGALQICHVPSLLRLQFHSTQWYTVHHEAVSGAAERAFTSASALTSGLKSSI